VFPGRVYLRRLLHHRHRQGKHAMSVCVSVGAQVDAVAVPEGPDNPAGNAFTVLETDLLTESGDSGSSNPAQAAVQRTSEHQVPGCTHRWACFHPRLGIGRWAGSWLGRQLL
jgi:hypothetical protein